MSIKQVCIVRKNSRNCDADEIQSSPYSAVSEANFFPQEPVGQAKKTGRLYVLVLLPSTPSIPPTLQTNRAKWQGTVLLV